MLRFLARTAFLYLAVGLVAGPSAASATTLTDTTTFQALSVGYDSAVWGPIKSPFEADAFAGSPPVDQFGFARFFLDPNLSVSSDGSAGPPQLSLTGQIVLTAKPGWGLYDASFTQSGKWTTDGPGTVSVAGSIVDIMAANGQFFFDSQRAFTGVLNQTPASGDGYYYIYSEKSSFSRFDQMTIDYDIRLSATAGLNGELAGLASDLSDPSFLGHAGPYDPDFNIVGTFVSVAFERVASPVPEPGTYMTLLAGLASLVPVARRRHRNAKFRVVRTS